MDYPPDPSTQDADSLFQDENESSHSVSENANVETQSATVLDQSSESVQVSPASSPEIKRLLNVLGLPEAQFLQSLVSMTQRESSLQQVLNRLDEKILNPQQTESPASLVAQVERLKAEIRLQETRFAHSSHKSELDLRKLNEELISIKTKYTEQQKNIQNHATQVDTLKQELRQKESVVQTLTDKDNEYLTKIQTLDAEKRTLNQTLLKKEEHIDRITKDHDLLSSQLTIFRQDLRSANEKVTELQTAEISLKSHISSREQQLEQVQKTLDWLNSEMKRKNDEFLKYRQEKNDEFTKLQSQVEQANNEKSVAVHRSTVLEKNVNDLKSKVQELLDKIQDVQESRTNEQRQFKIELASQTRLSELYKTKADDLTSQNSELHELVQELEHRIVQVTEEAAQKQSDIQAAFEKNLNQLKELQGENEKVKAQLNMINANPQQLLAENDSLGELSATALSVSRLQKSGKTFTEIYSDYTRMQGDLMNEKQEVTRLNECLHQILAEMEQQAPVIQRLRDNEANVRRQVEKLTEELSNTMEEKAKALNELQDSKQNYEVLNQEQRLMSQENRDLSRQVQALLRHIEQGATFGSDVGLQAAERAALERLSEQLDEGVAADAVISERLVVFRNIEELQTQNQALRRSLRTISQKLEAQEQVISQGVQEQHGKELSAAANMIERLQQQLQSQTLAVETLIRERDQWRTIADARGAARASPSKNTVTESSSRGLGETRGEFENLYRNVQKDFDVYRKEVSEDIKRLKKELQLSTEAKTELTVQVARLNSQVEYLNERYTLSQQTNEAKQAEIVQLRERVSHLSDVNSRQDEKIQEQSLLLIELRQSVETLRSENSQLQIAKEVAKSAEERRGKEAQDLIRERNNAAQRANEFQRQIEEKDRQYGTEKQKADDRLEQLIRDLQVARKQVVDLMDDNRTLGGKRDAELQESQIKLERLNLEKEKTKGELALAHEKLETATTKCNELTNRLKAAEDKLSVYEGHARAKTVSVPDAPRSTEDVTRDFELKLSQSRVELNALKEELALERERVETFRNISQASEERLRQVNDTFDHLKQESETQIQELRSSVKEIETDRDSLREQLARVIKEFSESQESFDAQVRDHEKQQELLTKEIDALKKNDEYLQALNKEIQADVSTQAKYAAEARESYEQEVVKHSQSLVSLNELKTKNISLERDIASLTQRTRVAEASLSNAQVSLEQTKAKLAEEIDHWKSRVEDLTEQNRLLHSQFEKLTINRATDVSEAGQSGEEGSVLAHRTENLHDLQEVIKYLRREKEILDVRSALAEQERDRAVLRCEALQQSLDEALLTLQEERKRINETNQAESIAKELADKIDQANLLRESNVTLRSELKESAAKLSQIESQLKAAEAKINPLQEKVMTLESEIEARAAENKLLNEDNQRWRARTQQILEKYERIDPVEHARLQEIATNLERERDSAVSELSKIQNEVQGKLKERDESVQKMELTMRRLKVALDQRIAEVSEKQKALMERDTEIERLKDPERNEQIIKLRESRQDLVQRSNNITAKMKIAKDKLQERVSQLEEELKTAQNATHEAARNVNPEEAAKIRQQVEQELTLRNQIKLTTLQKQLDKAQADLKVALERSHDLEKLRQGVPQSSTDSFASSVAPPPTADPPHVSKTSTPVVQIERVSSVSVERPGSSSAKRVRESGEELDLAEENENDKPLAPMVSSPALKRQRISSSSVPSSPAVLPSIESAPVVVSETSKDTAFVIQEQTEPAAGNEDSSAGGFEEGSDDNQEMEEAMMEPEEEMPAQDGEQYMDHEATEDVADLQDDVNEEELEDEVDVVEEDDVAEVVDEPILEDTEVSAQFVGEGNGENQEESAQHQDEAEQGIVDQNDDVLEYPAEATGDDELDEHLTSDEAVVDVAGANGVGGETAEKPESVSTIIDKNKTESKTPVISPITFSTVSTTTKTVPVTIQRTTKITPIVFDVSSASTDVATDTKPQEETRPVIDKNELLRQKLASLQTKQGIPSTDSSDKGTQEQIQGATPSMTRTTRINRQSLLQKAVAATPSRVESTTEAGSATGPSRILRSVVARGASPTAGQPLGIRGRRGRGRGRGTGTPPS